METIKSVQRIGKREGKDGLKMQRYRDVKIEQQTPVLFNSKEFNRIPDLRISYYTVIRIEHCKEV